MGKAFNELTKGKVKGKKDLNISDKRNELKQTEIMFSQNLLNDMISDKLD